MNSRAGGRGGGAGGTIAPTLAELRAMPDEELIRHYDRTATSTGLSLNFLAAEITRREQSRQTRTIVRLTWAIAAMTLMVTVATIVNVASALP